MVLQVHDAIMTDSFTLWKRNHTISYSVVFQWKCKELADSFMYTLMPFQEHGNRIVTTTTNSNNSNSSNNGMGC